MNDVVVRWIYVLVGAIGFGFWQHSVAAGFFATAVFIYIARNTE